MNHGTPYAYKRLGCRCLDCTAANTVANQKWRANRSARGDKYDDKRRTPATYRDCVECGNSTRGRGPEPTCKPCAAVKRRSVCISRPRRQALYARDSWTCGFCGLAVDPLAEHNSPWQATLDHIQPRSLGGSDDESNLRLLHRYCNNVRSNRPLLTLQDV